MTIDELARRLGKSPEAILDLKTRYPDKAPKSYGNVASWKAFLLGYATYKTAALTPRRPSSRSRVDHR